MSDLVQVKLLDVVDHHFVHAGSFWIPDESTRNGLQVGDFAKLCFLSNPPRMHGPTGERMWVKVTARDETGGAYEGILDSKPTILPLRSGDPVVFTARHVMDWKTLD